VLDLRDARSSGTVQDFLNRPLVTHCVSWVRMTEPILYIDAVLPSMFDGLISVPTSSPTTPTGNARRNAVAGLLW
jgi:hypothetical protein